MADMVPSQLVNVQVAINLTAGEKISIKVLNPDDTVKTTVYEASCPEGKVANGSAGYGCSIVDE